jgi:hypothetical protein
VDIVMSKAVKTNKDRYHQKMRNRRCRKKDFIFLGKCIKAVENMEE